MRAFNIQSLDTKAMETCRYRIDNLTKPIYSLAMLETIAERFAGVLANPKPNHLKLWCSYCRSRPSCRWSSKY